MKASIVVSVYNEADILARFWEELNEEVGRISGWTFELVLVNDGSTDQSQAIIEDLTSPHEVRVIEFSRNFGHEAAMIAGVDHSTGDAVICMDADLQHPPSVLGEMLQEYARGTEIITMIRTEREDGGWLKKSFGRWFYRMLNSLSDYRFEENASDFFLISSRVAAILRDNFRERNRFLRGYIQIIGFDKTSLHYEAKKRGAGQSKYGFRNLFNLANIAIFSFSRKPLYVAMVMAILFIVIAIVLTLYTVGVFIWGEEPPPGYTTIIAFLSASFAILFFVLAIQSLYLGRGVEEIKERPLYIVKGSRSKGSSADPTE